jgi:hypothetical protein
MAFLLGFFAARIFGMHAFFLQTSSWQPGEKPANQSGIYPLKKAFCNFSLHDRAQEKTVFFMNTGGFS